MKLVCNLRFVDYTSSVNIKTRSHRVGHAGGRGRWAHHDDPVLIVVVGGDRGDGGVIDQGVGVVGARWIGADVTAVAQRGLSDDQHAARRLQHDHLPHPRRSVPPGRRSGHDGCERAHSPIVCSSTTTTTTLSASFSSTTRSPTLKAPTRSLSPAPPARTQTHPGWY